MRLGSEMEKVMLEQTQMQLLETADGIRALYGAMLAGVSQVLVAPGKISQLREKYLAPAGNSPEVLFATYEEAADSAVAATQPMPEDEITAPKAIAYFKELLSAILKRPVAQIEADAAMEAYGIDSIMVMQMTHRLESVFGTLPKTLFFEYQNLQELTGYFLENHSEKLTQLLDAEKNSFAGKAENAPVYPKSGASGQKTIFLNHRPSASRWTKESLLAKSPQRESKNSSTALDIAIIGVAGRYPQADNVREFWHNLRDGKDCITEIPKDRWDYRLYFDEDKEKEGKSYSKWGGFLSDVDKFDPLFFNISPLEAERMDPQERLFLQCVYETIEDAGYTRHTLNPGKRFGLGNQVGVYVGVMYEEYQLFGAQEALYGRPVAFGACPPPSPTGCPFCDFHGPSMAVDTMCSSSLTAIHLACESIVRGKCEVAIAGG